MGLGDGIAQFMGLGAGGNRIAHFHWRGLGLPSPMGLGDGRVGSPNFMAFGPGGGTITGLSGSPWVGGEIAQL